MRLQLALNVDDLETAIEFYKGIFAVDVHKREPGYANFVVENPPLKLVLFEAPEAEGRLNHLGVEVFDDADVAAAGKRLEAAHLAFAADPEQVCCYAKQNKVQTTDPQGLMWEWYRVLDESPGEEAGRDSKVCC